MKLEVLHVEDCPSWREAGRRVDAALEVTGNVDVIVGYTVIRTPDDAANAPFAGSPTITMDGADLFPSDGRTRDLACRIYATPSGLSGVPTVEQLVAAVEARARPADGGTLHPRE